MEKIDEKDLVIIKFLIRNSRTKNVNIADETGLTSPSINYRIKKLKKNKTILEPVLALNMEKFDHPISAVICLKQKTSNSSQLIEIVKDISIVAGIDKTIGKYDLCMFIFCKNISHIEKIKQELIKTGEVLVIDVLIFTEISLTHGNLKI